MLRQSSERLQNMECACSSADRVPGYEPVGRGFESPQARHKKTLRLLTKGFFNDIRFAYDGIGYYSMRLRRISFSRIVVTKAAFRRRLFHYPKR